MLIVLINAITVIVGGVVGAAVSSSANSQASQRDIAKFLMLYYRKSSAGVTYIELTHR